MSGEFSSGIKQHFEHNTLYRFERRTWIKWAEHAVTAETGHQSVRRAKLRQIQKCNLKSFW